MKQLGILMLAVAGAASAQVEPIPSVEDSRIGIVHYSPDQPIRVQTSPGNDLAIILPADEHIQSVVVGDTGAYRVTVSGMQDGLFVRALRPAASTEMAVRTEVRAYDFILSSANAAATPYLVRVDNLQRAMRPAMRMPPVETAPVTYRLSGNKALLPTSIRDDGAKIYIEWGAEQAIPAVFSVDGLGREEMVNGYMRAGTFTIDRIYDRLVFRLDKAEAAARRTVQKVKK